MIYGLLLFMDYYGLTFYYAVQTLAKLVSYAINHLSTVKNKNRYRNSTCVYSKRKQFEHFE